MGAALATLLVLPAPGSVKTGIGVCKSRARWVAIAREATRVTVRVLYADCNILSFYVSYSFSFPLLFVSVYLFVAVCLSVYTLLFLSFFFLSFFPL